MFEHGSFFKTKSEFVVHTTFKMDIYYFMFASLGTD